MALTLHGNNGLVTTNGTAAAPSLAAPDNDTGLYFGTNLIAASTDGTERLRIGSTGLISIGDNTNLDSQLTVTQTQGDCIRLRSVVTNNAFKYGIIKQEPYNLSLIHISEPTRPY